MERSATERVAPQFVACVTAGGVTGSLRERWPYAVAKRTLDILVAGIALVVLLPFLALCALLVILDSRGPVFFRQERVGKDGRLFSMVKFRSMRTGADQSLHHHYVTAFIKGQAPAVASAESGELFKLVGDPRVTRMGRWMRRTSVDELPQLWNVLRGDMSLVGPRPPIAYELDHYDHAHMRRLLVTPGMTGLWQVSGRSRTTFEEMVALDLRYIETRSFVRDAAILLKTIPVVLLGGDAG